MARGGRTGVGQRGDTLRRGRAALAAGLAALAALAATGPAAGAAEAAPAGPIPLFTVERAGAGLEVVHHEAATVAEAGAIVDAAAADGDLVAAAVDTPVQALAEPLRPSQWALDRVPYERTWTTTTAWGVKVAVIDTGVRADHEDLAGAVARGVDYVGGGDGSNDQNGHGTHVAAIIAARAGNGRGIAGAAPGVKILPVRVLDANGAGYSSDVAEGIIWAADHGARVINLSLGGPQPSEGMRAAIEYAVSKGAVVLAAAGNGAQAGNAPIYPAAFAETVAVGSVDEQLRRSPFSNYGAYVDLAAPGSNILSAWRTSPTSYAWGSGTSMATPYASAAAALVIGANPALGPGTVRDRLEGSATDLGPPGRDAEFGAGLVNPLAAARRPSPPAPRPPDPPPAARRGGTAGRGYWVVTAEGRVRAYGGARNYGDAAGRASSFVVAAARTPGGGGYWLAGADGSVYAFGDARYYGSMYGRHLNAPIVGMAATPSGRGYFLLGGDGGIFTFGDARFRGSTGAMRLNAPVLDMTTTASGDGYWLVAADGGIFTFGDARFRGSTGAMRLWSPATSMTADADGDGYWIVARDGGIFTFGVPFHGSLPGLGLPSVPVGSRIRALPDGEGYYILTTDGGVYAFGDAKFHGSAAPLVSAAPAVDLMLLP